MKPTNTTTTTTTTTDIYVDPKSDLLAKIHNWFRYHPPTETAERDSMTPAEVGARYERLRDAGKAFAEVIAAETPICADQTVAIRHVREAVFTANAAIACGGR
jgi:hypothetical protein